MDEIPQVSLDYIAGCSMFIPAIIFKSCGLFNDQFFLYYEEIDLCKRVKKNGFNLKWCCKSLITHKGGATTQNFYSKEKKALRFIQYHENISTLTFTQLWFPHFIPLILFIRITLKPVLFIIRRQPYLIPPLIHAIRDFYRGVNLRENYGK